MTILYNPKTPTLFRRGDDFKVTNQLTDQRFTQVKDWLVTHKMDGMSVIMSINPNDWGIHGRTANTKFNEAQESFMLDQISQAIRNLRTYPLYDDKQVHVYAELLGPGINGNKHNLDKFQLKVFDIRIDDYWLDWDNMRSVCYDAGITPVERIGLRRFSIDDIVALVKERIDSPEYFEGVVARSDPYLYNNRGNRLAFKLKVTDF